MQKPARVKGVFGRGISRYAVGGEVDEPQHCSTSFVAGFAANSAVEVVRVGRRSGHRLVKRCLKSPGIAVDVPRSSQLALESRVRDPRIWKVRHVLALSSVAGRCGTRGLTGFLLLCSDDPPAGCRGGTLCPSRNRACGRATLNLYGLENQPLLPVELTARRLYHRLLRAMTGRCCRAVCRDAVGDGSTLVIRPSTGPDRSLTIPDEARPAGHGRPGCSPLDGSGFELAITAGDPGRGSAQAGCRRAVRRHRPRPHPPGATSSERGHRAPRKTGELC